MRSRLAAARPVTCPFEKRENAFLTSEKNVNLVLPSAGTLFCVGLGVNVSSSSSSSRDGDGNDDEELISSLINETLQSEVRSKHENRLVRDLLTGYEPAVLPSLNASHAVTVKMGIALFQIRELVR